MASKAKLRVGRLVKNTIAVKKELYQRIRVQIADRLGQHDREIRRSEKALSRLFSQKWAKTKSESFQKALERSKLVFWGDFHGVRQSQKTLLRWLEEQGENQQHIVLALECFPSNTQKYVDQYLAGELSESEFLNRIHWRRVWGFPWEHYRPLLEWAKRHKRPVLAINAPGKKRTLAQRENWALQIISDYQAHHPHEKVWALYGEYHLLPQHFRKRLKEKSSALFILQNSDRIYLEKPGSRLQEEILKGPQGYFCLQNVPPWVKWQTYLLFLDLKEDQEIDEGLELTDHVLGWARVLSQELGLPLKENEFNVYTSDEAALWEKLKKESVVIQLFYRNLLEEGFSFVSPAEGWAYLSRISVNESAGLAMQMLFIQQHPEFRWPISESHSWDKLIWIFAISYLGSKIINPHRKTPTLQQLQKRVRSSVRPFERQAARLAVAFSLKKSLGESHDIFEKTHSERVRFLAAKWLAGLWGEKLYNAYHQKALSAENLKSFLARNPNQDHFDVILHQLLEIVNEVN